MVKSDKEGGTIFSIDVDGREYWITAKHILTGAKHPPFGTVEAKTVTLSILSQVQENAEWHPISFKVLDPGKDVDIIVLAPETSLLGNNPIQTAKVSSAGVMLGGECEFVGFPFGNAWAAKYEKGEMLRMPFVKRCTISGHITSPAFVWVLDGINNFGFSGGPVVVETGSQQHIIGVVSGFQSEPIEVVPIPDATPSQSGGSRDSSGQPHPKEAALANTGFFFAYDMTSTIEAIKKNPIGPERKDNKNP